MAANCLSGPRCMAITMGRPRRRLRRPLPEGRDALFDIDWQGAQQLAERMPDDVVSVFVLPPSMAELKARLERRAEDDAEDHRAPREQCPRRDRSLGRV